MTPNSPLDECIERVRGAGLEDYYIFRLPHEEGREWITITEALQLIRLAQKEMRERIKKMDLCCTRHTYGKDIDSPCGYANRKVLKIIGGAEGDSEGSGNPSNPVHKPAGSIARKTTDDGKEAKP
jgi:hypothetical protein